MYIYIIRQANISHHQRAQHRLSDGNYTLGEPPLMTSDLCLVQAYTYGMVQVWEVEGPVGWMKIRFKKKIHGGSHYSRYQSAYLRAAATEHAYVHAWSKGQTERPLHQHVDSLQPPQLAAHVPNSLRRLVPPPLVRARRCTCLSMLSSTTRSWNS